MFYFNTHVTSPFFFFYLQSLIKKADPHCNTPSHAVSPVAHLTDSFRPFIVNLQGMDLMPCRIALYPSGLFFPCLWRDISNLFISQRLCVFHSMLKEPNTCRGKKIIQIRELRNVIFPTCYFVLRLILKYL